MFTCTGNVAIGDVRDNEEDQKYEEEKAMEGGKSPYPLMHCLRITKRNGETQSNPKCYYTFT